MPQLPPREMRTELWANSSFNSPAPPLVLSDRFIFNKEKKQEIQHRKKVYNKRKEGKTSCHRGLVVPSFSLFFKARSFIFCTATEA